MSELFTDIDREIREVLESFEDLRLHELSDFAKPADIYTAINAIGANLEKSWSGIRHINKLTEQAQMKVNDAEREAQMKVVDAKSEARMMVIDAEKEAEGIKQDAHTEAARIKEAAEAEAARIKEAAEAEAARIKEAAEAEAAQIKEAAETETHRIKEAAKIEADRINENITIRLADIEAIKKDTKEIRDALKPALEAIRNKSQSEITPPQSKKRAAATDESPIRKKKRTKSSWTNYSSKITSLCGATRPNRSITGYNQFLNLVPHIIEKEDSLDNILKFLEEGRGRGCLAQVALGLEGQCDGEDHVCEYVEVVDGRLVMN